MTTIKIEKHGDGYKASVVEKPGEWGCGSTSVAAIGKLVCTFPKTFGIELNYPAEVKKKTA